MRILLATPYFPPEPGAGSTRASDLAAAWAAEGHEVHVLCGLPCYPRGIVHPGYERRAYVQEDYRGARVHRGWVLAAANEGRLGRGAWFASQAASMIVVDGLRVPEVDVVVATSPHILAAVAGAVCGRRRHVPLVLDIRDLWPRSIWELGAIPRGHPVIRALEGVEAWLYRTAARVVVVSPAFVEPVRQVLRDPLAEVPVITNGVRLERFDPGLDGGPVREGLGIPSDAFVALYAGTHGEAHGLGVVVEAARRAPEITWLLVGDGSRKAELVAQGAGIENLRFEDAVPAEAMAGLYAAADVGLVPLRDLPLFETVLPSKIFELWAMATPVVLGVRGEAARLVREGGSTVVPPEDPEALVAAVRALAADPEAARAVGQKGRALVEARYDRAVLARRYLDLLGRVVAEAGARR